MYIVYAAVCSNSGNCWKPVVFSWYQCSGSDVHVRVFARTDRQIIGRRRGQKLPNLFCWAIPEEKAAGYLMLSHQQESFQIEDDGIHLLYLWLFAPLQFSIFYGCFRPCWRLPYIDNEGFPVSSVHSSHQRFQVLFGIMQEEMRMAGPAAAVVR